MTRRDRVTIQKWVRLHVPSIVVLLVLLLACGKCSAFVCDRRDARLLPWRYLNTKCNRIEMAASDDSSESNSISGGIKRYEAVLKSFVDKGEASTLEEARKAFNRKGIEAKKAKYTEEELRDIGRRAYETTLHTLIDRGEASTLEEARKVFHRKGIEAKKAKYTEEELRDIGRKAYEANLHTLVDKGEASTPEEARKVLSRKGNKAKNDKYTQRGIRDISSKGANIAHKKKGRHVKYSGVHFDKRSQKWRLQISYKGNRISAGYYYTEDAAARAHDDYVRKHGLDRPLHFPSEEERARDEAIPRLKQ